MRRSSSLINSSPASLEDLVALTSLRGARPLRDATEAALDRLPDWEREAFLQAGYFEGGFTLEAAEAVIDLEAFPDATRFHMYVYVREVARRLWEERADEKRRRDLARRHAEYYGSLTEPTAAERDNLAVAPEWARAEGEAELAARLEAFAV